MATDTHKIEGLKVEAMLERRDGGASVAAIAKEFGETNSRTRTILNAHAKLSDSLFQTYGDQDKARLAKWIEAGKAKDNGSKRDEAVPATAKDHDVLKTRAARAVKKTSGAGSTKSVSRKPVTAKK